MSEGQAYLLMAYAGIAMIAWVAWRNRRRR
jgi:hypothetical protein